MKRQRRKKLVSYLITICMLFSLVYPAAYAEGAENTDLQTASNELENDVMTYYVGGETGSTSGKIGVDSEYPFATLYDAMQVVNQKSGSYNIVIQGNTTENKAIVIGDGINTFNVVISNLSAVSGSAISGSVVTGSAVSGSMVSGSEASGIAVSGSAVSTSSGTGFTITSAVSDGCLISVNKNASLTLAGNTDTTAAGLIFNGSSNASYAMFHVFDKGTLNLHSGVTIQNNINTNSSPDYHKYDTFCGGICNYGCFIMDGGTISGNSSSEFGGVYNGGKFILSGGSITGNRHGGVYNDGTFEMSGGNIINNTAMRASGVDNSYSGIFSMTGGTIVSSDTEAYAGIYSAGTFIISGDVKISGTGNSKKVYLRSGSYITIGGNLTCEENITLIFNTYNPGRLVLSGDTTLIQNNYSKFNLTSDATQYSILENGTLEYHGVIKTYYVDSIVGKDTNSGMSEAPFATIQRAVSAIGGEKGVGTIYICSDLTLTDSVNIWGTVTIRNHGEKHTIYRGGTFEGDMFNVWGTLILGDSEKDGVDNTISLALDGNQRRINGGIIINEGFLILHNGVSLQNSASYTYGGILNESNFTMYGGSINNNNMASLGGGVHNLKSAIFTMKGGIISNNTSSIGGAIVNAGKFIMTGGNISNNSASRFGNGVFCESGTFTIMDKAMISSNDDVCLSKEGIDNVVTIGGKLLDNAPFITINTIYNYEKAFHTGDQIVASAKDYSFTEEDMKKLSLSDTRYFINSTGKVNARLQDNCVTLNLDSDIYYRGNEIKPIVSVFLDHKLTEGSNYVVSYENNTGVGKATIYIDGINNYCGQVKKTFIIQKAAIQRITTAAPMPQNFKASEGKSEADLLSAISLSSLNAEYNGGTVNLPITWKRTGGTYDPKGGTYTYKGTPTDNDNIDIGNAALTTSITVTASKLTKPTFDNIVIAKRTNAKASAKDLGNSILPVDGSLLIDGKTISYKISWDNQTLNTTIPEASTEFTGTITYPGAPDWATLPTDLIVKRTVSIAAATSFTIMASAGNNGSITPNGNVTVNRNAEQGFTIKPLPGCIISDVIVDGKSIGAVSSYTFTYVLKNHNISASFITPTPVPTVKPTVSPTPSAKPTVKPTVSPTPSAKPTVKPTVSPTPTVKPTVKPTVSPTPTVKPTVKPTVSPTPTTKPTDIPTLSPTPIVKPSDIPTVSPTPTVSATPSVTPTPTAASTPSDDKVKEIQAEVSVKVEQDEQGDELNSSVTISEAEVLDRVSTGTASEQTKITIPVTSEELTQQIKESKASKTNIKVTVPSSLINNDSIAGCDILLDSDIMEAAKDTEKDITVTAQNEKGNEMYSWTFKGSEIADSDKQVTDINLSLEVEKVDNNTELSNLLDQGTQSENNNSNSLLINFSHHGDLPSQATVKIYVGDLGYTAGQMLNLYYYNSESGKLETLPHSSDIRVDSAGYVIINIVHCSEYVLMSQKAGRTMITSLLNQISISPKKATLYLEDSDDRTALIHINLPSTLKLADDLQKESLSSAIGAVTATYQSSNEKITVNRKGKITAKGIGKAVINVTVKLYSGKTRTFKVNVTVKKHKKN